MYRTVRTFRVLWNVPGDAGSGGGPAAAVVANDGPSGTPPPAAAGPASPAAGGGNQPPAGASDAEREAWFQNRIRSEGYLPRHAATRLSSQAERLQLQLQQEQQRIRALAGVEAPPDPEEAAVRSALTKMFPFLEQFEKNGPVVERMMKAFQENGEFDTLIQTQQSIWGRTAYDAGGRAAEAWAKLTGQDVKEMSPAHRNRLARDLRNFILEDETGRREQQYNAGDQSLIEDFVQDLQGFFVKPLQQQSQQQAVQRVEAARRLPQQGPRSGPPPQAGSPRPDRRAISEQARQAVRERMPDA